MKRVDLLKAVTMVEADPPTSERQSPVTKDANTLPGPLRTSVRRIEANRRNALHSTGPTTPEGKQASRLNALKHGLRAKDVIIPGQEEPAEFEAILRELFEDWEPEGHTETHLVEQIGLAEWRLRRVHRAELGEIRKQMASPTESESETKAEIDQAFEFFPKHVPQVLGKSTAGIARLRGAVEDAREELESEGIVSEDTCLNLEYVFGKEPDSPGNMLRDWFQEEWPEGDEEEEEDSDDKPTPTADNSEPDKNAGARRKAAARRYLKETLKDLDRQERKLHKQERTDLEISRQRLSIPEGDELERLQRYETSIKRGMYRDIDQLERLQRRRRGELSAPTVNVNVSNDD